MEKFYQEGLKAYEAGEHRQALRILRPLAWLGHAPSQFVLGHIFRGGSTSTGDGIKQSLSQARHWYQHAADQGHEDAQWKLGQTLIDLGDYQAAKTWLAKAASENKLYQWDLARYYYDGTGLPQDKSQALHWFKQAAARGDADSHLKVAEMYLAGDGVVRDESAGVAWYRKIVEEGDPLSDMGCHQAMFHLGRLYETGRAVNQDLAEALSWYRRAFQYDNANASLHMGKMFLDGRGVAADALKAEKLLEHAALNGHLDAQMAIADLYEKGAPGVARDMIKAALYYYLGLRNGYEPAYDNHHRLYPTLTEGQRAEVGAMFDELYKNPRWQQTYFWTCADYDYYDYT